MNTAADVRSTLERELGSGLAEWADDGDQVVRVNDDAWATAAVVLRSHLGFGYFCFLSAIDWLPNPNLDGEHVFDREKAPKDAEPIIVDPAIRKGGGQSRFQVIARVANPLEKLTMTVVADLVDDQPRVASWTSVYRGADWHERETWEMFGIVFDGHPGLRHIYLPGEFEGHPLRKDYLLLSRVVRPWPGLVDMEEMPAPPVDESEQPTEPEGDAKS